MGTPQRLLKDHPMNSLWRLLPTIISRNSLFGDSCRQSSRGTLSLGTLADNPLEELSLGTLADDPLTDETLADNPLADDLLAEETLADNPLADETLADETLADNPLADDSLEELSLWRLLPTILLGNSL